MPGYSAAMTPPSFGQATFTAAFFEAYEPPTAPLAGEAPCGEVPHREIAQTQRAGISYSAERYGSYASFCEDTVNFAQYRQEMRGNLDLLAGFCQQHGMSDAKLIARRFDKLFHNRFQIAYFDTHAELIDSVGKRALDDFCALVGDARVPVEKKMAAIRNLSEGIEQCASGAVSNLIFAHRELLLSCGGFRAALCQAKEALVHGVLLEAVREKFGGQPNYRGNEIHYGNSVWNYLASSFGLAPRPDWMAPRLDIDFLESCRDKVHAKITPDRIARLRAEQCLAKFNDGLSTPVGESARCDSHATNGLLERIEIIRGELGLDEEQLSLHAFVRLDADGRHYVLRSDASLIAWSLMGAMREQGLMDGAPVNRGVWQGADDAQYALLTAGASLAVRARRMVPATGGVAGFTADESVELDSMSIADLRAWAAAQPGGAKRPPYLIADAVIRAADPVDIMGLPARWLGDVQLMLDMFGRMRGPDIQRYLKANLAYFLWDLPEQHRVPVFTHLADAGVAARSVARAWFSNSWRNVRQWADGAAQPAQSLVFRGMSQGSAAVIDAVRTLAVEVLPTPSAEDCRVFDEVADAGTLLILSGSHTTSALHIAMAAGHAQAIGAWHRLLVEPKVFPRVASLLLALVSARDNMGRSGLCLALAHGHGPAIKAYGALLADPAVVCHVAANLVPLLSVLRGNQLSGLLEAICRGHTAAVDAYVAVLTTPAILPHIAHALPELLSATGRGGGLVLGTLMEYGKWSEAKAYCTMLSDSAIRPYIEAELPELTRSLTLFIVLKGVRGIATALLGGHTQQIQACHALVSSPLIGPCFGSVLPSLLACGMVNGGSALAFAVKSGHVDAIRAYHALLADPAVLPHIGYLLPDLLTVNDLSDDAELRLVLHNLHTDAAMAYDAMWTDPAFAAYIR